MSHTPIPWSIVQDSPNSPKVRYQIGSRRPDGLATYVCTVRTERSLNLDGNETANAAFIVNAANCHDELLAALREAEGFICGFEDDEMQEGIPEMLARVRAAIAKAEGAVICSDASTNRHVSIAKAIQPTRF